MSIYLPIADVRPDPEQPRKYFRKTALAALAQSIKKTGQRQAITVRQRVPGAKPPYEIIDGERRFLACQIAGIATIRADIEERPILEHTQQHLLSLASNFMREGHTHMEISQAIAYQVAASIAGGKTRGQAINQLCEAIGESDAWIYQYLQLQNLGSKLQELMHPEVAEEKRVRFAEAVVLAGLPADKQTTIYRRLLAYPPSARGQKAKALASEATGTPVQRRKAHIKRSTSRFVVRVRAEIERVLDYKQKDFRDAFAAVPAEDRKGFRASLAMLLDEVDSVMKGEVRRG